MDDEVECELCLDRVQRLAKKFMEDVAVEPQRQHVVGNDMDQNDSASRKRQRQRAKNDRMRRIYGRLADSEHGVAPDVDEELSRYYRLAQCDMFAAVPDSEATVMVDPLAWWKEHQHEYPRIAVLARRFLCIAPTSVPCERAFPKAGWIVNKRRCSLSDGHISSLVFVSSNRQYRSGL